MQCGDWPAADVVVAAAGEQRANRPQRPAGERQLIMRRHAAGCWRYVALIVQHGLTDCYDAGKGRFSWSAADSIASFCDTGYAGGCCRHALTLVTLAVTAQRPGSSQCMECGEH
jgi:hypothetical protein